MTIAIQTVAVEPADTADGGDEVQQIPPSPTTGPLPSQSPAADDRRLLISQGGASSSASDMQPIPPRIHTNAGASPHALTRVVSPTSNTRALGPAGGTSALSTSVDTGAAERLGVLRAAMRKMRLMLLFGNIVLLASVLTDIPNHVNHAKHNVSMARIGPGDPEKYDLNYNSKYWLQLLALYVYLWYAWTSCSVWSDSTIRQERDTPFWATLRWGLQDATQTRYTAQPDRKTEASRVASVRPTPPMAAAPASPKAAW